MPVKVHGGVINDQTLAGSLRFFELAGTGVFANTIATTGMTLFAQPVDAGSGYAVNDTITVAGGTGTASVLTVAAVDGSGGVTRVTVSTDGAYSALPTNPVSQSATSGSGTGATFDLTFSSTIVIPGGSITEKDFHVAFNKAVVNSAADRVLRVIAERSDIVQIAVIDNNTVQVALENTSFGWADATAMQTAIQALGTIGSGANDSNDPPVPDTTSTGTTVDVSGVTVTEKFFSSGLA